MIKFFRQIRFRLMETGKTSRYFKYAIGEIVLVVIGILIALQINTWNENRKLKQVEIKALREIQKGFQADTADLSINVDALRGVYVSSQLILKELDSSRPYHDSLSRHFAKALQVTRLISNDGPYEVLKSKGLDLVSNDSIRQRIVDIYDGRYEAIRTWEQGFFISDRYIQQECIDLFDIVQTFDFGRDGLREAKMVPHDFEALKTNERYKTMTRTFGAQSKLLLMYSIRVKRQLEELLSSIEHELIKLAE